jgi:hypothetical protein
VRLKFAPKSENKTHYHFTPISGQASALKKSNSRLHMDLLRKLRYFIEIIKAVKRRPSLLLLYAGLRQNVTVKFRNNITVKIADKSKAIIAYQLIKVSLNSRALFKSNGSYTIVLGNSGEVFSLTDEFSTYGVYVLSYLYKN